MKKGTAIGWLLVAISVLLSVWVIAGQNGKAAQQTEGDFVVEDSTGQLVQYNGSAATVPDFSTVASIPVTSIGPNAFKNNGSIQSLTVPATVASLSPDLFSGCGSLTTINIASGNPTYTSYDGCVYEGTELKIVPPGKGSTVSIAAGTTSIAENAFIEYGSTEVTIPNTVSSIGTQSAWGSGFTIYYSGTPGNAAVATWALANSYNYEPLGGGSGTTHVVTFDLQGHGTNFTDTVNDGDVVTEPTAPTATGYTFGGWFADAACTTAWDFATNTITDDTTVIYAKWTADTPGTTYTITYYGNGGTSGGNTTVTENVTAGSGVTLADKGFTYSGYTLAGWGTSTTSGVTNALGTTFTPTGNVNLYAQWTANGSGGGGSGGGGSTTSYTVTYNANGGTGSMDAQSFTTGGNVVIKANSFAAPSGKYFTGWNSKADGSGTAYSAGATYNTAANLTLYAQWSSDVYTVTYNANGGAMPGSTTTSFNQSFAKGGSTKIAGKIFQRTGFDLDYWTTNSDGSGTRYNIDQTYSNQSNLTLYAHWTALNSQTGASGTTSNGTHAKDNTPSTADGDIDPRIVLCVAVAALGIAIIVSSNRRKISYINHKKDRTEE